MQDYAISAFVADLLRDHGAPRVLDVDHAIEVYKPTLSGRSSDASYYIRPPDGMTADELIELFHQVPGFDKMNLALVSILGLDTYHQPLLSVDDFAKRYFGDNHQRLVRVVGKSDPAIAAMAAFIDGLKPPFDAAAFPHYDEFLVSGYRPPEGGRSAEVKLLFKLADASRLMKVEREVRTHLDEINLGREIVTSRHSTRDQAPELILSSRPEFTAGCAYLDGLAKVLRPATEREVAEATESARRMVGVSTLGATGFRSSFAQPVVEALPAAELKRRAIVELANILRSNKFADGGEIQVVQGGTAIEVTFPRTPASLWLSTSFDEKKDIKAVSNACLAIQADPVLRDGWAAHYSFDRKSGKLVIKAVDAHVRPSEGMKAVPSSG